MRLLLFSNSTNAGEDYLGYTLPYISEFIEIKPKNGIFIPFAGISVGFDKYADMVAGQLQKSGIQVKALHRSDDMVADIKQAEIIITGGGNTFYLLKTLQDYDLLPLIRDRVKSGTPYIGWSAGSNMACPTISTTNDMPIVQPHNFLALNLIPFQINPHFTDYIQQGHAGETREMRINEYLLANQNKYVAGLKEGTLFQYTDDEGLQLKGPHTCKVFKYGKDPVEVSEGDNLSFLMQ